MKRPNDVADYKVGQLWSLDCGVMSELWEILMVEELQVLARETASKRMYVFTRVSPDYFANMGTPELNVLVKDVEESDSVMVFVTVAENGKCQLKLSFRADKSPDGRGYYGSVVHEHMVAVTKVTFEQTNRI